jgi:G3E family GTPase
MHALVLVAGYLGAGKTRTLTELVPRLSARGWQPLVVLSDARNARIDATRFVDCAATVHALCASCVCCDGRDDLLDALAELPLEANQVVLIESSGTTDTEELLSFLAIGQRLSHFAPPMQVTVVDTLRWQQRHWYNEVEQAQVRTASHLICNWQGRAGAERVQAVTSELRSLAPTARIVALDALVDAIVEVAEGNRASPARRRLLPLAAAVSHQHDTTLHHVASFDVPLPARVQRHDLAALVRTLPASVIRVKGLAVFEDDPTRAWVWHRIDGSGELFTDSIGASDLTPVALCIGGGAHAAAIRAQFAALGDPPAAETSS